MTGPGTVILCTNGSHGDVNPFIAVALALKRRGARPIISTNPYFQAEIEREGIGFHASGEYVDVAAFIRDNPWMHNPMVAGTRLFRDVVLPRVPAAQTRLAARVRETSPRAVVVHPLCLGAAAVCDELGVPWLSMVLSPVIWMSRHEPCCTMPIGPGGHNPPLWWWRFIRWGGTRVMRRLMNRPLNRDRAARGLAPLADHWHNVTRGGTRSLAMWSPAFRPPMPDDPPRAHVCGFPFYDQSGRDWEGRDRLERFLSDGPPPVLFSLGTATVYDPGDFYRHAAGASRAVGCRAVLLIGRGGAVPTGLSKTAIAVPYAPFSWLMPRCAASVHHGGIGSTAQGLRAGKPTVIVPHSHDQFDNAARCERLGVSVTLPVRKLNTETLTAALLQTLEDRAMRAAAASLAPSTASDGAEIAAEEILGVAEARYFPV